MEGSERRARARTANKPARYVDDDESDEPPVKRARDGGGEVRSRARRDPANSAIGERATRRGDDAEVVSPSGSRFESSSRH